MRLLFNVGSLLAFTLCLGIIVSYLTPESSALLYNTSLDGVRPVEFLNRFAYAAEDPAVVKELMEGRAVDEYSFDLATLPQGGYYAYDITFPKYYRQKLFILPYSSCIS